ncbi:Hypothetical protein, putative [Bodo saltans]|uniref:Uncharacterized protein n=1 Tax=Bodo saltans TaxID=75058 RepID=A0A0S4KDS9_BODSA|nr:Hypothetical protein, putative [Bodo saltans]|eukprot:CUI11141.1 Hypothetical protein, putative [Bodo saltans]
MLLSMIFEYDCDMDIEAYIALASAPRQVDERNASLSWIPPQKQQFAVLKDTPEVHANVISLKDFGCEYEIAVKSGFSESGDLERRTLFRDVMLMCVDQGVSLAGVGVGGNEGEGPHVTESKEWYIYTLRRMSCQHIERVMAAVRKRKHFSDDRNDAIVHRDVLFIAYCGLKAKMTYHSKMVELFSPPQPDSCATMNMYDNVNRHPMVPPDELNELFNSVDSGNVFSWPSFYRSMCSSSSSEAQKYAFPVARYASALVRFLIPVYTFSLGPIPDPALWEFEFSASDVEALYHGDCNDARLRIVKESLMAKNCPDLAVDSLSASGAEGLRTQMWNLAYATHVLLWGLLSNDRRLMNLFRANHKLLGALDTVYSPTNDVAPNAQTCFYYLRDIRNFARTARRCQCANRPPWLQAFHQPQCDARHDFWSSIRREHYTSHPSYTELDKEIRQEILIWGDNELLDVVWQHCNDRVVTVQNEFGGSRTLRKHWNTIELLYRESTLWLGGGGRHHDTAAFHSFLLSLLLGTDLPTSDPHHGEGYDRMVAILTASIRKLVLDVRLCHDNYHTMHLKYWRYSASERSLISIPYGRNVIIVRDVQPKRLNNSRIVDIGLNLNGLYHISETPSSQIYELNHEIELEYLSNEQLQKYPHSPAPLRQFLLDTAWKRDGSYVLHGFCDDSSGSVHEVKISVTLPHIFRKGGGQFEDLEFSVRIDNEDTQRCTIITVNAPVMSNNFSGGQGASPVTDRYVAFLQNQSTSFLRLGIQLHDVGIAVPHDHVVRESSECLGAALDGEKQLESENRKVLEAAHRSRAMQLSPEMLEYLPNTNRGLRDFLRTNIESQMPELMHFFANPCVTILGLASREIPHAKTVLQEALYTVIDMSIDDLSFATTYDAIKNLGTMSAISILHLSILSPLSAECMSKLVNVTVKTSLRFIVEVSGLTIPLFSIDRTTTRCIVQLLEHRVALIDQNSKLGNVIVNASNQVMNAPMFGGLHNALREDCENTLEWSLQQNEALSLLRARDMAMTQRFTEVTATNNGQIIGSNKLVVVVNGDRSLLDAQANETTARDCWYQDLKRVANQRECIQQLLWAHQEIPVVLALHSLDQTAPFLFFRTESKMDNEVLEPVVFRPDLVISNRTPLEDRFALILGCRKDEYLSKVDTAPVRELATVLGSVRINSVIPTFEAFLRETPFMELMSHVLRVSIYLYYIVGITRPQQFHLVVEMVQGLCHNNFTRTVWDSICWEVPRVIQREPAYLESDYFHFQKSAVFSFTAIDSTVANELKDNHPICVSVLEKWFTQLPSSNAIRQYILENFSMEKLKH